MKVRNEVGIYEIDGTDHDSLKSPCFVVENHWDLKDRVIVAIGNHRYTVIADDLIKAIRNATNV